MKKKADGIVTVGVIAALYVMLTIISSALGLAYSGIQFRISEGLMILALFSTKSVWGVTLGCALSNILSPLGIYDVIFGSIATLISAIVINKLFSKITNDFMRCLVTAMTTAVINAAVVGCEMTLILSEKSLFLLNALPVFVAELVVTIVCYVPITHFVTENKTVAEFLK